MGGTALARCELCNTVVSKQEVVTHDAHIEIARRQRRLQAEGDTPQTIGERPVERDGEQPLRHTTCGAKTDGNRAIELVRRDESGDGERLIARELAEP